MPDATSAYPYLLLYESRQRRFLGSSLEGSRFCSKDRFMAYPCAVGQTTFSSGRHYWEVGMNITGDALWALDKAGVSARGAAWNSVPLRSGSRRENVGLLEVLEGCPRRIPQLQSF